MICVRIARWAAWTWIFAVWLLPFASAAANGDPQLLAEFRKTRADVSEVHVIAETPLMVAVSGPQSTRPAPPFTWAKGELLGVFAHSGDHIVQISMSPNDDFPTAIWIDRQNPGSITFGLADPEPFTHSDNLKIFFDPKNYFPKRIVRFAPVRVQRIALIAGVLTLTGTDGKQDFTAREYAGAWRISSAPALPPVAPRPLETVAQIAPMPVSTFGEFEKARPEKAKGSSAAIEEKIGPYQKVGTKLWIGKTFSDTEGAAGVGDIGYFDEATQDWVFLHVPEMADWSTSALLVEPDAVYVGRIRNGESTPVSGGLLRYDRATHKTAIVPLPETIDKIVRVGRRLYCGTSGGFAIMDQGIARRFEFSPQLDGSYAITPLI